MKRYEVTFSKSKDHPTPADFFHIPADLELRNMTIVHNTTRSEKWEYEIDDLQRSAAAFEYAVEHCKTASSFRELNEVIYTVLATSGWQGSPWHVAGTFDDRKEAQHFAQNIHNTNPRMDAYLIAIIRSNGKPCAKHSGECWTFDLRGKKYAHFERHLRGVVHAQIPQEN